MGLSRSRCVAFCGARSLARLENRCLSALLWSFSIIPFAPCDEQTNTRFARRVFGYPEGDLLSPSTLHCESMERQKDTRPQQPRDTNSLSAARTPLLICMQNWQIDVERTNFTLCLKNTPRQFYGVRLRANFRAKWNFAVMLAWREKIFCFILLIDGFFLSHFLKIY